MMRADTVDEYLEKSHQHRKELEFLRSILTETELEEEVKWGGPIYTLDGKNVVGMASFKSYVGLWFHQGVFLEDTAGVLINAASKTKGLRQWRFNSIDEMDRKLIASYIAEAIENQKQGKEIAISRAKRMTMPDLLAEALASDANLSESFDDFTAFKQKEFADYISEAKQEATKRKRLEKVIPMIKSGIGLNDKYR